MARPWERKKRPRDAEILQKQEADVPKCVEFIRNNPGLHGDQLPRHFRVLLKRMETRGLIEYRNDGWFVK
jgi:hypothetical protein